MTKQSADEIWKKILAELDEKLQYGLLEQARSVSAVELEGSELILSVTSKDAEEFFNAHINQQRLIIMARAICAIDRVGVRLVDDSDDSISKLNETKEESEEN